jgi:hypothetical protein
MYQFTVVTGSTAPESHAEVAGGASGTLDHVRGHAAAGALAFTVAGDPMPMTARPLVRKSSVIMDLSAHPARFCMVAESRGTREYMTVP